MVRMDKKEVMPGIISLRFKNQYETCATFMRLQEFYESPYREIRGKFFTTEKFMDRYARDKGNFTYTLDWGGFNVPGHVVRDYFTLFMPDLNDKENCLCNMLADEIGGTHKFYVIGHYEKENKLDWTQDGTLFSALAHETAHGLFYVNDEYRKLALNLIKMMPAALRKKMEDGLKKIGGYCRSVMKDEMQAYLATSDDAYIKKVFGGGFKMIAKKFRGLFLDTAID
jgi:hypothetical protein